jgi:hypothetical protein
VRRLLIAILGLAPDASRAEIAAPVAALGLALIVVVGLVMTLVNP